MKGGPTFEDSLAVQVASARVGDVECGCWGEQVSLVRGAVVVRCEVRFQEGGEGEVGRAFLEALGVEVKQNIQLVFYWLYL